MKLQVNKAFSCAGMPMALANSLKNRSLEIEIEIETGWADGVRPAWLDRGLVGR